MKYFYAQEINVSRKVLVIVSHLLFLFLFPVAAHGGQGDYRFLFNQFLCVVTNLI